MARFPADSAVTKHGFADEEIAQTQCIRQSSRRLGTAVCFDNANTRIFFLGHGKINKIPCSMEP
jgi:hypothetical protein